MKPRLAPFHPPQLPFFHRLLCVFFAVYMAFPPSVILAAVNTPRVVEVRVNSGSPQRSTVTNLAFVFSTNLTGLSASNLVLNNLATRQSVNPTNVALLTASATNTITYAFPGLPGGTLPGGNYAVALQAAGSKDASGTPLDGNADGRPGDPFVTNLFTFFGDGSGDRDVDYQDNYWFRRAYGSTNGNPRYDARFDVNADGRITTNDLAAFDPNFFRVLPSQDGIFAGLVNDTGLPFDYVTLDPTIAGALIRTNPLTGLRARLNLAGGPPGAFADVTTTTNLTADGSFWFTSNYLSQILGDQLVENSYLLHLESFALPAVNPLTAPAKAEFDLPFVLGESASCILFPPSLSRWTISASLPSALSTNQTPIPGSVVAETPTNCAVLLREGDSFQVTLERTFTVPTNSKVLSVTYEAPTFDGTATNLMRDAFEVAVLDAQGKPLTFTIQGAAGVTPASAVAPATLPASPDACFNHSDGQTPFFATGTALTTITTISPPSSTLAIDLSRLAPGTPIRLVLRLLNNDLDRATFVRITDVSLKPYDPAVSFGGSPATGLSLVQAPPSQPTASAGFGCLQGSPQFNGTGTAGQTIVYGVTNPVASLPAAPTVSINAPANNANLSPGAVLLSGYALVDRPEIFLGSGTLITNQIVVVTINGNPVSALDPLGNFYSVVQVQAGKNFFELIVTDSFHQNTTNRITVVGTSCPQTFATLGNVTASLVPVYGRSSFNERTKTIYADLAVRNSGTYSVRTPFYVGISSISDPTVHLLAPDGTSVDGIPYYDFAGTLTNSTLNPHQTTLSRTLVFHNPNHVQFTYNLAVLGQLNQAPSFTTAPPLEVIAGRSYTYAAKATDPDGDTLAYSLLESPGGMTLSTNTGLVSWSATNGVGVYNVRLGADDGRGGSAMQHYVLTVIAPPLNRPPLFVSTPVEDVTFGQTYTYAARATDLDGDVLTCELLSGPTGMTIVATNGDLSWVPTADQNGVYSVSIRALDGRGGIASQKYALTILPQSGNHSPIIVSEPPTTIVPGGAYYYDVEALDSDQDTLLYKVVSGPPAMTINPTNGLIYWAPSLTELTNSIVEFVESEFHPTEWASRELYSNPGNASISVQTPSSGGNPGAYRRATQYIYEIPGGVRAFSAALSLNFKTNAVYDPQVSGAILRLQSDYDAIALDFPTSFSAGMATGIALEQDGKVYRTSGLSSMRGSWTHLARTNLIAADFALVVTAAETDPTQNPDFSNAAKPITFGIYFSGSASITGSSYILYDEGLDNLRIAVVKQVTVPVTVSASDGKGGSAKQDFTISTLGASSIQGFVFQDTNRNQLWDRGPDLLGLGSRLWRIHGRSGAVISRSQRFGGRSLAIGPDDRAYAASSSRGSILVFESGDDRLIGQFTNGLPWWDKYVTFGPDGNLYVATSVGNQVLKYASGVSNAPIVFCESPRSAIRDLTFGPDSNLYTVSDGSDEVFQFNGASGALLRTFVNDPNTSKVLRLWYLEFGPDTNLYVNSTIDKEVLKFNGTDGSALGSYISYAATNFSIADFNFGPDRLMYAATGEGVQRADGTNGTFLGRFDEGDPSVSLSDLAFAPSSTGGTIEEPTLAGWRVYVDYNRNGRRDEIEPFADTDAKGRYAIGNLRPGTYMVRQEVKPAWQQTCPPSQYQLATTTDGEITFKVDFGNVEGVSSKLNAVPYFVSTPRTNAVVNETYSYAANAFDPDGDLLTYSIISGPAGMVIGRNSGILGWVPAENQANVYEVVLQVADGRGGVAVQSFQTAVYAVNTAPQITSQPPTSAQGGVLYQYYITAQDAEGDDLSFNLTQNPTGMTLEKLAAAPGLAQSARISWTPAPADAGSSFSISIVVRDGKGKEANQAFALPVFAGSTNHAPTITTRPRTNLWLSLPFSYRVEAFDLDGDALQLSLVTGPPGMALVPPQTNGVPVWFLNWTPPSLGANPVVLQITDSRGGSSRQEFTLEVRSQPQNGAPQIVTLPPLSAVVGQPYAYNPAAVDPDGDELLWSLVANPAGMSLDPQRGTIRWMPAPQQLGTNTVTVQVSDVFLASAVQTFEVRVRSANGAPSITTFPPTEGAVGQTYAYAIAATDPDGDALSFQVVQAPTNMTLRLLSDGTGGPSSTSLRFASALIEWLPVSGQSGTNPISIEVRDGNGGVSSQQYDILVAAQPPNRPPVFVSQPARLAAAGATYQYQISAVDPDNDPISFQLLNPPSGMQLEILQSTPGRARLTWTPQPNQVGNVLVSLSATDVKGASGNQRYLLQVRGNQPPQITSAPRTNASPLLTYRYDLSASDADGDPLSYALTVAPAGMAMSGVGQIVWTPTSTQLGSHPVKTLVTDGFGGSAEQSYTIMVAADTNPPTVSLQVTYNLADGSGHEYVRLGSQTALRVVALDDVGIASLELLVAGTAVSLGSNGSASVAFQVSGHIEAISSARDLAGNTATVTNLIPVVNPDALNSVAVTILSPTNNAAITHPAVVRATLTSSNSPLNLCQLDFAAITQETAALDSLGDQALSWRSLTNFYLPTGVFGLTNFSLGLFDPTILANGTYVLRVTEYDLSGRGQQAGVLVNVSGNLKFGEFRLAFTDLSVPVAGIPITITRVYDTRDSQRQGDFGYGWSLGLTDGRIVESAMKPGFGMMGDERTLSTSTHIYLTKPDGRRVGFRVIPKIPEGEGLMGYPPGYSLLFGFSYYPAMEPDSGVYDKLEAVGAPYLILRGDGAMTYPLFTFLGFDPDTYRLTTKEGTVYEYSQNLGLQSASDPNGNRLAFTRDGIFHYSAGSATPDQQVPFIRDAQGRITRIIDPAGKAINYTYDTAGDMRSFSDQVTNLTRYAYSAARAHFLTNIVDPLGRNALRMEYDASGRLTVIRDALGNPIQQNFDLDSNTVTFKDANGHTNIVRYDDNGNETMNAIPGIFTNYFAYDANNNLTNSIDGRGFVTTRAYDSRGNVTNVLDAVSNTTAIAYNNLSKPISITDAMGHTTQFRYDGQGQINNIVNAHGGQTFFTRDYQGRVASVSDANGHQTIYNYAGGCSCGKPSQVINPDGTSRTYDYNSRGDTIRETDELGNSTLSDFDDMGRLMWVRDAGSNTTSYAYAGLLKISETDALGRTTYYAYDAANRQVAITNAMGGVVRFEYDNGTNRTAVIDPAGNATRFYYDAANRLSHQVGPWGRTNFFAYDAAGNRTEAVDRNGRKRTFHYDGLNRCTNELWWEGTSVVRTITSTFNSLGVMTSASDPASHLTFEFDALSRLDRSTQRGVAGLPDFTLTYRYDGRANVVSVEDNWGTQVASEYDARNRLTRRLWQGGGIPGVALRFAYDAAGNRTNILRFSDTDCNNLVGQSRYAYNNLGAITDIFHASAGGVPLVQYHYERNPAQEIAQRTLNSQLSTYHYDLTGQLTNALYSDGQASETYNYDPNGNRTGDGYALAANNQIIADSNFRYGYDAEGCLGSRTNIATGATTAYRYDHRNRLLSVVDKDVGGTVRQIVDFVYDALNRRIAKSVNGTRTWFLLNKEDIWADTDDTGSVSARYLVGKRVDEMLARYCPTKGALWYLTDNLGTVRDLTDSGGTVVAHVSYDSFGRIVAESNSATVGRFLFTGRERDGETGLYYYRARFFNPDVGSFINVDPLGPIFGDINSYRYAHNNPLLKRDPMGLFDIIEYAISLKYPLQVANTVDSYWNYGISFMDTPTWNTIPYHDTSGAGLARSLASASVTGIDMMVGDIYMYVITYVWGNAADDPRGLANAYPVLPNIWGSTVSYFHLTALAFDAINLPCGGQLDMQMYETAYALTIKGASRKCR